MNNQEAMMSSATPEWGTPQDFFNRLDSIYHFDVDPCATHTNRKCRTYYTREQDGLTREWLGNAFMNPPYGREICCWIEKAYQESTLGQTAVVCLVPARTNTKWFQACFRDARCITFLPGRLKSAPFPSALIVFAPSLHAAHYQELKSFGPTMACEERGRS